VWANTHKHFSEFLAFNDWMIHNLCDMCCYTNCVLLPDFSRWVSVQTAHKYQRYKTESPCFFLSRNTLCPKFARIEENRQHSVSRYIYVTIHLFESKHSHTYLHRYIYMYCCINIQVCYIWVTWNLRMQGMPHFYPWHNALRCVAWLVPGIMLPSYNRVF